MPRVSVVIPVYNCEKYIAAAIDSVLCQTYKDYEIIVVNDGSSDGTNDILLRYGSKIRVVSQTNSGPAGARNTGVFNAKGEFIAFLDQDDTWLPQKLSLQVPLIEANKNVGVVCCDTYIVDSGKFDALVENCPRSFHMRKPHRGRVFDHLFFDNFISTSSVIVRKECFSKVGMFDKSVVPIEDFDRWLRISAFYDMDYVDMPLVKFRDHVACFRKNEAVTIRHIIDVLTRILPEHPEFERAFKEAIADKLSGLYVTLGKKYLRLKLFNEALGSFREAFRKKRSFFMIESCISESLSCFLRFL